MAALEAELAAARAAYRCRRRGADRDADRGGRPARRGGGERTGAAEARRGAFPHRARRRPSAGRAAGVDRVEFEVSTNPGAPFAPLVKIASGGELSRFILALKVALAEQGGATTMIFDEIDRGVGGAVASAIGERLAPAGDDRAGAGRDPLARRWRRAAPRIC